MFEELEKEQKEEKQERAKIMEIAGILIVVAAIVGGIFYLTTRGGEKAPPPAKAPVAQAAAKGPADAVRDLHLLRVRMGKDPTGIRVLWSIAIKNRSTEYTYSEIQYQAFFLDKDNVRLAEVNDTIHDSIGPGEEKTFPDFVGGTYDPRSSTYQFVIKGATAK